MSEHTKEPWEIDDGDGNTMGNSGLVIFSKQNKSGDVIAQLFDNSGPMVKFFDDAEANARRIVSCVNACAGISTETLELLPYSSAVAEEFWKQRDSLAQRDTAWAEIQRIRVALGANLEESTADEAERVVAQRDKLLAALKKLEACYGECAGPLNNREDRERHRSVLAEVSAIVAEVEAGK